MKLATKERLERLTPAKLDYFYSKRSQRLKCDFTYRALRLLAPLGLHRLYLRDVVGFFVRLVIFMTACLIVFFREDLAGMVCGLLLLAPIYAREFDVVLIRDPVKDENDKLTEELLEEAESILESK